MGFSENSVNFSFALVTNQVLLASPGDNYTRTVFGVFWRSAGAELAIFKKRVGVTIYPMKNVALAANKTQKFFFAARGRLVLVPGEEFLVDTIFGANSLVGISYADQLSKSTYSEGASNVMQPNANFVTVVTGPAAGFKRIVHGLRGAHLAAVNAIEARVTDGGGTTLYWLEQGNFTTNSYNSVNGPIVLLPGEEIEVRFVGYAAGVPAGWTSSWVDVKT